MKSSLLVGVGVCYRVIGRLCNDRRMDVLLSVLVVVVSVSCVEVEGGRAMEKL